MRWAWAVLWLASRGLVLWLYFGPHSWVTGDVAYFAQSLRNVDERGLGATLVEYPLPAVLLVAIPWLLADAFGQAAAYSDIVLALAVLTDAGFAWALHRFGGMGRNAALGVWVLAVPLLGATAYARFDLVPGVLAGLSLLLVVGFPRAGAMTCAVAAGLKLWPALLLPAFAAKASTRRQVVTVALGVGGALALGSLVVAGWDRLVSPLTWQAERGLQVESVAATPAMLAWALGPGELVVDYTSFNAFEVSGPGTGALLRATTVLTVVLVAGLLALWVRAWRRGDVLSREATVWLCLASVSGFMVSSKVLSPQYLLWLLPVAAAGLAVVDGDRPRRDLLHWSLVLLVVTGATQLVFPVFYGGVVRHEPESFEVVLLLLVRNALLVALTVLAFVRAWRATRLAGRQRGIALERQPPGPDGSDARTLR